jgi:hypothetical protein
MIIKNGEICDSSGCMGLFWTTRDDAFSPTTGRDGQNIIIASPHLPTSPHETGRKREGGSVPNEGNVRD